LAVGLALALSGCGGPTAPKPRPVTKAQAERLAEVLFRDGGAGGAHVHATVPLSSAGAATIDGDVDWTHGLGTATVTIRVPAAAQPRSERVAWSAATIATPAPDGGWSVTGMQPDASPLQRALVALVRLAADRPEDTRQLVDHDARYLGTETIDGHALDAFTGPAGDGVDTRYVLAADGTLRRAYLRTADGVMVIDVTEPGPRVLSIDEGLVTRLSVTK
jgi:hypothetical protein